MRGAAIRARATYVAERAHLARLWKEAVALLQLLDGGFLDPTPIDTPPPALTPDLSLFYSRRPVRTSAATTSAADPAARQAWQTATAQQRFCSRSMLRA